MTGVTAMTGVTGGASPTAGSARLSGYFDHNATTPCDERVFAEMAPWFGKVGNASTRHHRPGREAFEAVAAARTEIGLLINAHASEIIFTSGATEANNLAIRGLSMDRGCRILALATEHASVVDSCRARAAEAVETAIVPVRPDGLVDLDRLAAAFDHRTALLCTMVANNEIGVLQPIEAIAALCRDRGVPLHSDGAQAGADVALDVRALGLAFLTLSAHKMYGPAGVGALYVSRRIAARMHPLLMGGGQERGLRSGSLPVPLIVGFGAAARLARLEREAAVHRERLLRNRMLELLRSGVPDAVLNGSLEPRLPGNLSVRFPGVAAERLIEAVPELAFGTGAACAAETRSPSHVLAAIGLDPASAAETIRIGIGRGTTQADVDHASELLVNAVRRLRSQAR